MKRCEEFTGVYICQASSVHTLYFTKLCIYRTCNLFYVDYTSIKQVSFFKGKKYEAVQVISIQHIKCQCNYVCLKKPDSMAESKFDVPISDRRLFQEVNSMSEV